MLCYDWLGEAVIRLSLYLRRVNVLFEISCYSEGVENSCVLWRTRMVSCVTAYVNAKVVQPLIWLLY